MTSSTLLGGSGGGEGNGDGEVEMSGINEVAKQDKEDRVFKWQEKVFSQVFTVEHSTASLFHLFISIVLVAYEKN